MLSTPARPRSLSRDDDRSAPRGRADVVALVVALGWILAVLVLDEGVTVGEQALLGLATWVVLAGLLVRESALVRVQVGVVIVFASVIEYAFAAWLGVYEYRLGGLFGVPSFVPPGHGIVYLAALLFARLAFVQARERLFVALTVVLGGAYALWGLVLSPQLDVLGAFWFCCLVGFLLWGPSRLLYVGAFVVVTYLEVVGTKLGVWEWMTEDFTGIVPIGNPPSVAAGGYGWFDLTAVLVAPALMRGWDRFRRRRRGAAPLLRYPSDPS